MKHMGLVFAALAIVAAATPAVAQNGAMWLDAKGRSMSMQFAGGNAAAPTPADRTPAELAELFGRLCIETGGDPARIATAADGAGLVRDPSPVPVGTMKVPVDINIWRADRVVVAQSAGFFAAPVAQCNAVFYVTGLPEQRAVAEVLEAKLGMPPTNAADAFKKNGKPNRSYAPEWLRPGPGGAQLVTASIQKGNQYMPGDRVHIAVRARKKAN